MNAKHLAAALSLVFAGTAAMASEATQFDDPVSTLSRSAVVAVETARNEAPAATVASNKEATQFVDAQSSSGRDRDDVRAEARAHGRAHAFNSLYVGA
jgi:hypothetical protein